MLNHYVLITGASSGIGYAMAEQLAQSRCPLILVARRIEKLEEMATRFRNHYAIDVIVVPCDLNEFLAPQLLVNVLREKNLRLSALINNAGLGYDGSFEEHHSSDIHSMLMVNVYALTQITHAVLPFFANEGKKYILNVASIAGYQPIPMFAVYSATKAYVLSLSHALSVELAGKNISVTALCPGFTLTEFFDKSKRKNRDWAHFTAMTADEVASLGLKAMLRGDPVVVTGFLNRLSTLLAKVLPVTGMTQLAGFVFNRALMDKK